MKKVLVVTRSSKNGLIKTIPNLNLLIFLNEGNLSTGIYTVNLEKMEITRHKETFGFFNSLSKKYKIYLVGGEYVLSWAKNLGWGRVF